jgi:Holliday junction resolvase
MMGNKEKGANAERELLKKFISEGYMAIRVAGSGILPDPSCDLIAGKKKKKFCIEVKSCRKSKKYLNKKQIENFLVFSEIFGLNPLLAIRFNREGWFFVHPKYVEKTGKGLAISLERVRKKGKRFGQAFG